MLRHGPRFVLPLAASLIVRSRTITSAFVMVSFLVPASCDASPVTGFDPREDDPISERSSEAGQSTNERGVAIMEWILGAEVGEQRIEITAPGAEPVTYRIEAVAGVVLVGLFTLGHEADQVDLPSDALRVHATNYRAYTTGDFGVPAIVDAFDEGAPVFLAGHTTRGPGFDTVWNFHFDPSSLRITEGLTIWNCWVVPHFSEEWMDQILGDSYSAWWPPCPGVLRLVGVKGVPAPYLAALASGTDQ